jgi:adenylate kinase family enzyme
MVDINPSIRKMYEAKILEAVHARRFDEALRLVTERNAKIWMQRGNKHNINYSDWIKIEKVFTKNFLQQKEGLSNRGEGLIFIVGMPRGGKSTLEKCLSDHASVVAGDELRYLSDQFRKLQDPNGQEWRYPHYIEYLPDHVWDEFGRAYEEPVKRLFKNTDFLIDTMPPNFRYLGLIKVMLPKAKVIHIRRDPLSHIVDMFSKVFKSEFYDYTNDWGALLEFYMAYRSLMSHWSHVLGDWMLEMTFEDLIHHPKQEIKKVMNFCEIDRNVSIQKLLEPHKPMITEIEYTIATLKNYHPYLKEIQKQLGVFKKL